MGAIEEEKEAQAAEMVTAVGGKKKAEIEVKEVEHEIIAIVEVEVVDIVVREREDPTIEAKVVATIEAMAARVVVQATAMAAVVERAAVTMIKPIQQKQQMRPMRFIPLGGGKMGTAIEDRDTKRKRIRRRRIQMDKKKSKIAGGGMPAMTTIRRTSFQSTAIEENNENRWCVRCVPRSCMTH